MNRDKEQLRQNFKAYLANQGYAQSTVSTMSYSVFWLWNKDGEQAFWNAVASEETELKRIIMNALETHAPKQVKYASGYLTSFRIFRAFLNDGETPVVAQRPLRRTVISERGRKSNRPILKLSADEIESTHQKVLTDAGYGTDYEIIDSALKRFPANDDPDIIALKIALIDMTNSTHLGVHRESIAVRELVDIILGIKDFDIRLKQGDPNLVSQLAKCNGKVNLFSFASKYCTYHNVDVYGRDDYSIFDNVVEKSLPHYIPSLTVSQIEKWRKTFDYAAYNDCIAQLLDDNDIHIEFRRRKLDHFLWYTNRKGYNQNA